MEWLLVDDMGSNLEYQSNPPHLGVLALVAQEHFALAVPLTTHVHFHIERSVLVIIVLEE